MASQCTQPDFLPSLQRVDPLISSYETTKHIVQGSAEGFVVEARTTDGSLRHLFVKHVDVKKYGHKPWSDLRRTCHYTRTEVRFYDEILPLLRNGLRAVGDPWPVAPRVYVAEYDLSGLIEEDASTAAAPSTGEDPRYDDGDRSVLEGKRGLLVMDDVGAGRGYFQRNPLPREVALASVRALARFHAASFGDAAVLMAASDRLCEYGGSYHLRNRNPKELAHMADAWEGLARDLGPVAPRGFFDEPSRQDLGRRTVAAAAYVSEELSPTPRCPHATVVHGDYKAMNVFFGAEDGTDCLLIDFASAGVGLGASDLAMHVAHAITAEDLDDGVEEVLVEAYFAALQKALPEGLRQAYTKEEFRRHYGLATVDYFRFILGRQWKGATQETFDRRNEDANFAMVNRSVEAALKFIERADRHLKVIEEERSALESQKLS
uniref:Aminoglycoside phosphotransferase domain-containing protein n=1 Tax=Corethron hystrix TaxID=216773 RepID=A0A7S1BWE7_9STRA